MVTPKSAEAADRTNRAAERRGKQNAYVIAPAAATVKSRSVVLSEVTSAAPRKRPKTKSRSAVSGPPVRMSRAMIHSAFHRLSVRYSIDFRKKTAKNVRSVADQI